MRLSVDAFFLCKETFSLELKLWNNLEQTHRGILRECAYSLCLIPKTSCGNIREDARVFGCEARVILVDAL